MRNYENACKNGTVSSADFTRIMGKASTQAQEYSKNIKEGTGSAQIYADKQKTLQQSIQNTGTASRVAAVGVKALSIAGNMLAGMAIAFAISKVIEGIEYLATASERAIEKTKELQQEISQISSDYQSERQTLEGLREEYDALTSKIGENGAEASLSADEYERYRDITSEILGITPKLITGWDEEGRAISNKNGLLQQSIDLLDEEYQKSLRNSTTKSKNEEIAAGIIEQKKDFDNSGDTKTVSGTRYDLVWKDLENYINEAVANKKINYTYESTGIVGTDDADAAYAINEFVYGDSLYKATEMNTAYGWLGSLQERITSSQENFEKFANSLSNEDNPIYQWFTDEQIDELIRGADEYFQELARIEGEEQQYFQQYKDQLNLNAQAVGDAYSGLDEQTKAGITQMIDSFDYNDMTKEKFSDMATDLKDFVGKLSTDDTLRSYFNNLFKPMGEDESIEDYETRVKTGIDEITSYCESNYPAIKLSFGDVESDVEALKLKYNTAISKFTGDANDVDLGKFFEDNSINDESEIDYWNKVTDGAKSASEAVEMYNKVKSETFSDEITASWTLSEDQSKEIDNFHSKIKTLSGALEELHNGTFNGSELFAEFPELASETDNLDEAIKALINESLADLLTLLGSDTPDAFANALRQSTAEAINFAGNVEKLETELLNLVDYLERVKSGQSLNSKEVANLIAKYPELSKAVIVTADGYSLEEDALINLTNTAIEHSNEAIAAQIKTTEKTIDAVSQRIEAYKVEAQALQTLNQQARDNGGLGNLYSSYKGLTTDEMLINPDSRAFLIDEFGQEAVIAYEKWKDNEAVLNVAKSQLEELKDSLNSNIGLSKKYGDNNDSSSTKEADETDWKEILDKETTLLEKQLEVNVITFKEYTDKRKAIIEDYYRKGLIAAEDYYSALEDMYDYQLSVYDRVISTVVRHIDNEIDILSKEKEAVEKTYETKIQSIRSEIDMLTKANDARKTQIELEELQYNRDRARNQRVNKLYTEDKGVIYTADDKAIRDAENDLSDKEFELNISRLENQIESLEKELDEATVSIDEQINNLKNYADQWEQVADEYRNAQDEIISANVLGQEWEQEILELRTATLNIFKDNYISAQEAMADAAMKSAQAQLEASKIASNAGVAPSNGSSGSDNPSGKSTGNDTSNGDNGNNNNTKEKYDIIDTITGKTVYTTDDKNDASRELQSLHAYELDQDRYYIKKYHKGLEEGIVGSNLTLVSQDQVLRILQKAGRGELADDEYPTILQKGEVVATVPQQYNIAEQLMQRAVTPNIAMPDYSHLNNVVSRNMQPISNVTIGDIKMYGVQDPDGFAKALNRELHNVNIQFMGK